MRHLNVHQNKIICAGRRLFHFIDCFLPVRSNFHLIPRFLQDRGGNHSVQLIILGKKNSFSGMILGSRFLRRSLLRSLERFCQYCSQFRQKQRFRTEICYTGFPCFLFDIRPVISCQNDDRGALSYDFSDPAYSFDSILIRHLPIDDINAERICLLIGFFCTNDSFLSVIGPVRPHTDFPEHGTHGEARIGVIVCHQRPQTVQFRKRFNSCCIHTDFAGKLHDKLAALAFRGINANRTAHHIHDIFRDCHTKSCALDPADGAGSLTGKSFKNRLLEFFAHPNSGILDSKFKIRCFLGCRGFFDHAKADHSAAWCKLDCIRQDIQQDLVEAKLIRDNILMDDILRIYIQIQLFCRHIRLNDRSEIVNHIRQMYIRVFNVDLSALYPAHIQNIIDQRKQVLAGYGDLPQVIPYLLFIINMRCCQCCKADDCIHRCSDIMGHVVQERRFGTVGMFSCNQRIG